MSLLHSCRIRCRFIFVQASYRYSHSFTKLSIGDLTIVVKSPKHPEKVPTGYFPESISQSLLRNLKWMLQKNLMGQDIFLIGIPGSSRRHLAMQYLELTRREFEFVTLTQDTTENDLKQRREICNGTAYYIDQSAVRAATEGRVLVLEGVEKAERNVLPVINNLLENREMQLEDGRYLMAAERYDKLLKNHTKEELDEMKLVRVSEEFEVLALGLPVPKYRGNPLDPPLRSRFQARHVKPSPFKEQLEMLKERGRNISSDRLTQLLSFAHTLLMEESSCLGLPEFPVESLPDLVTLMNNFPSLPTHQAIRRVYPYEAFLGKDGKKSVVDALNLFDLLPGKKSSAVHYNITGMDKDTNCTDGFQCWATLTSAGIEHLCRVPMGRGKLGSLENDRKGFVTTPYHDHLLADMFQSHAVRDLCLIGPRGCSKSRVANEFARLLGYEIESILLYQDMSCRDLFQQRITLPTGDTSWRLSSLVTAALQGKMAVLDGLHRLHHSVLSSLHRLAVDRELQLYDGTRLLRHDRYDLVRSRNDLSDKDMAARGVLRIHPSFRMVALAEPPVTDSGKKQWLNAELLDSFHFLNMRALTEEEERILIGCLVHNCPRSLDDLLRFTQRLRSSTDPTTLSVANSLSTRQLLRIARYFSSYGDGNVYEAVHKACLSRFLPPLAKKVLEKELNTEGIFEERPRSEPPDQRLEIGQEAVRIGNTSATLFVPKASSRVKVPDILFYNIPQHVAILEEMLRSFLLGEHLLLVGNQGVGKNKLVDRFLQLLNRPREYLQLHRDTSVQTLTLQSSVRDGIIVYEDSPLVRAVEKGHVLVVDEADKAPTHVTCILKALVESGEMLLSDGRKIVPPSDNAGKANQDAIITHPEFRLIVLANRPGFPFLGNDFFGALGDSFSCHVVDNPTFESEMAMLRQYGPDVPERVLHRLVKAFGELRSMADDGLLSYPFSTREAVSIVKHLQKFPQDGVAEVVRNVFDFDAFSGESKEVISRILHKHGIPLGADPSSVSLSKSSPIGKPVLTSYWYVGQKGNGSMDDPLTVVSEGCPLSIKAHKPLDIRQHTLDKIEARSLTFTEEQHYWTLPLPETAAILDVAVTKAEDQFEDTIHVLTCNPLRIYSMRPSSRHFTQIDLFRLFPSEKPSFHPKAHLCVSKTFDDRHLVLLHEDSTNKTFLLNTATGDVQQLLTATTPDRILEKMSRPLLAGRRTESVRLHCNPLGALIFQHASNGRLDVVDDISQKRARTLHLPFEVLDVNTVDSCQWLLTSKQQNKYLLRNVGEDCDLLQIHTLSGQSTENANRLLQMSAVALSNETLSKALGLNLSSPNRVIVDSGTYGSIAVGFPDLKNQIEVYTYRRAADDPWHRVDERMMSQMENKSNTVVLAGCGQIVRALPQWLVPRELVPSGSVRLSGFLQVVDLPSATATYIPIPSSPIASPPHWHSQETGVILAECSNETLVTVDQQGCIRTWETGLASLERSIAEWKRAIGSEASKPLQLTIEKESGKEVKGPKHGKVDLTGAPHVGGNMWAGGTGGRDTAGLGGMGGPYRLDGGHDVFQVSQAEKDAVPEEIVRVAREMAQKAFQKRLKEIRMSEHDAQLYDKFSLAVRRQVQLLRVILDALQAKGKERHWLKHQSSGELDDYKLIEGVAGERSIYKRRGNKEPEMGSPQEKPKRLRILVDVSGSMYRFNGYDNRLERQLEALVMVMESLQGYESKFEYDVMGHSGEEMAIEFVQKGKPPKNDRERLDVLKTMHAHTQFCMSGDHTLPATQKAIDSLRQEDADEHFVVVLSDANLDRYGIPAEAFGQILTSDPKVGAFAIFLGSLGDQAERLSRSLPSGRAFVCMDTKELPHILQQILASSILSSL